MLSAGTFAQLFILERISYKKLQIVEIACVLSNVVVKVEKEIEIKD